MIMKNIQKIKANLSIYASKRTTNILDGSYRSVYKGRTMNFEDLRAYVVGDNIKDIDWKASARSNNLLVKQYIAEKKHNIMFVFDTGKKMLADTETGESKTEISIMAAGTIAYLANKNGDYVGSIYNKDDYIQFHQFKSTLYNIENILCKYEADVNSTNNSNIEKSLEYIYKNIKKRMIIFIITDLKGMESIEESTLKKLTISNDVLIINVNDAYMCGELSYDIEDSFYVPKLILNDKKLQELEKKLRKETYNRCLEKFEKYKIFTTTINSNKEIIIKIIELLERQRNAIIS